MGSFRPCATLPAMTFAERLDALCRERRSQLCVGLDPLPERLPAAVRGQDDPVFAFNRAIVDATIDLVAGLQAEPGLLRGARPRAAGRA